VSICSGCFAVFGIYVFQLVDLFYILFFISIYSHILSPIHIVIVLFERYFLNPLLLRSSVLCFHLTIPKDGIIMDSEIIRLGLAILGYPSDKYNGIQSSMKFSIVLLPLVQLNDIFFVKFKNVSLICIMSMHGFCSVSQDGNTPGSHLNWDPYYCCTF
jgi:hypothetical protein